MIYRYYRGAVGALITYDITSRSSYENIVTWISEIKNNAEPGVPIVLVGNKLDLENKRVITTQEANDYADKNDLYFIETSARTSNNVEKAFTTLFTGIYEKVSSRLDAEDAPPPDNNTNQSPCGLSDRGVEEVEEEKVADISGSDIPDWAEELFGQIHQMQEQLKVVGRLESTVENMCKKMEELEVKVNRLEKRKIDFKTAQSRSVRK